MRAVVPGRPGPPGRAPGAAPGRRAGGGGMRLPAPPPGGGGIGRPAVNGRCGVAAPGVAPGNGRCGGNGRDGAAALPGRDEMTRGVDGGGVAGAVAAAVAGGLDSVTAGGLGAWLADAAAAGATGASTAGATGAAGAVTTFVSIAATSVAVVSRLCAVSAAFGSTFFAAAFFAAGFLAGVPSSDAAAFFAGAFFFFGSSGGASRTSPRSCAWRRTRSACASTMPDEGDVAPMANSAHSASSSLFVMPSSLASAETRTFLFKVLSSLHSPRIRQPSRCPPAVRRCRRLHSRSSRRDACRRSGLRVWR